MSKLHVAPRACSTCPYRRDTPPGIWTAEEYRKLPYFDMEPCRMADPTPALVTFACHQEMVTQVPTVCRGWLSVHRESVAVRFAVMTGKVEYHQVPRTAESYLYSNGTEACKAGLAGVDKPSPRARLEVDKLLSRARSPRAGLLDRIPPMRHDK